ncbi:MAG: hypothetical protein ACTHMW_14270, partial [Actinomycetes bacterium]
MQARWQRRGRVWRAAALSSAVVLALAGCSSSGSTDSQTSGAAANGAGTGSAAGNPNAAPLPDVKALDKLGTPEGQVNVIAWAGYAEDGSNDPKVDWVHPFEKATGCTVNVKIGNTSDEMVQLMKTGQYDVVSASGDATLRLIYGGDVAPVNTALVPNYATIYNFLKNR